MDGYVNLKNMASKCEDKCDIKNKTINKLFILL